MKTFYFACLFYAIEKNSGQKLIVIFLSGKRVV